MLSYHMIICLYNVFVQLAEVYCYHLTNYNYFSVFIVKFLQTFESLDNFSNQPKCPSADK
jgi:hypothetical protein